MGIKIRTYHDLLDRNDELSAYLLGFWMADGNIFLSRNGKRIQKNFQILNTDYQIMSLFGKIFGKIPRPRRTSKSTVNCYSLKCKSDQLFDKCYSIIGSTSKSDKRIRLPKIKQSLFHHFIRGFFDGDGSIYHKTYKNRHGKLTTELGTSFTAGKDTGDFLEEIRNGIRESIPVGMRKISGKDSKKLSFGQYDSMLLCEWMYKDATIYMKRKKEIWDETDKIRLNNSKKYFSNKV